MSLTAPPVSHVTRLSKSVSVLGLGLKSINGELVAHKAAAVIMGRRYLAEEIWYGE
jgi:hypothetical protein